MKVLLMHQDRDFDLKQPLPSHAPFLVKDLELDTVLRAMAGGDAFLSDVARQALLCGAVNDVATIRYRQDILGDCLRCPSAVREMYAIASETIADERRHHISIFSQSPAGVLYDAIHAMEFFVKMLRKLRAFADAHAVEFRSTGFSRLFLMLQREFTDDYFAVIDRNLRALRFDRGVLMSAKLTTGNLGTGYVLRKPHGPEPRWWQRVLERIFGDRGPGFTYRLHERDEVGARILGEMRNIGLNLVANALAQSAEHILNFFQSLRTELAFYVACLNLHDATEQKQVHTSIPQPSEPGTRVLTCDELHDISLVLTLPARTIGNTVRADGKNLLVITGANQGGKSSFLRGLGLAQLMMQAGMFVAARSFGGAICRGVFTHYKREEDVSMSSGKLDEELARLSQIIDAITSNSMLLLNESFASTNEREGSEIARQVVQALVERGVKVVFVTHLYDFALDIGKNDRDDTLFLRAERLADGTRTYKLVEARPLDTSFGEDLYKEVFETAAAGAEGGPPK